MRCRKADLYRCIVTVGSPSFITVERVRKFGLARVLFDSIFKKVGLVFSNIQSDKQGMRMHPVFETHVSDEKRIVSYNLGMTFAKLYSERVLGIPNLVHLEFLKKQNAVTLSGSGNGKRPKEADLVGQTADGEWHIFEAKGISTSESKLEAKVAEAKAQIRQVVAINGVPPATGSACATYIGPDRVVTLLEDPPGDGSRKVDVDTRKFVEAYYAPFLLAASLQNGNFRKETIDGLDVEFCDLFLGNKKLSIGLDEEVAEWVRAGKSQPPIEIVNRLRKYSSSDWDADRFSVGLDGFVIKYGVR